MAWTDKEPMVSIKDLHKSFGALAQIQRRRKKGVGDGTAANLR
jgi:hypothetical protein